jgi:hypothetical protein
MKVLAVFALVLLAYSALAMTLIFLTIAFTNI